MKILLRFIPMAAVMGIIFFLSHQPGDMVHVPMEAGLDKILHAAIYSILAGTLLYGLQPFSGNTRKHIIFFFTLLFCLLYGISDEYHQSFIPGRHASVQDILADLSGALLAAVFWLRKQV